MATGSVGREAGVGAIGCQRLVRLWYAPSRSQRSLSAARTSAVFAAHSSWLRETTLGVLSYDMTCGIATVTPRRRSGYGSQIHPKGIGRIPVGTGSLLPQTQVKELP